MLGARSSAANLRSLLAEVDSALKRLETGSFGLCEVCHGEIEPDRLAADPLTRFCLDHLTPSQQRALEQDLELASGIQGRLLPQSGLVWGGHEICYLYRPAGPTSGDYIDYLAPSGDGGKLTFVVGDVSGKGIAASLLMSQLHALFRSLVPFGMPLGELVSRINRLFGQSVAAGRFATLAGGTLAPDGTLEICNAGHCPPLLIRAGGVEPVAATGLPVGIFSESVYEVVLCRLEPGDTLFLYTDGLPEAQRGDEEYGQERIARQAGLCRDLPPADLVATFADDLDDFRGAGPVGDDLTLMAIRRH